MKKQFLARKDLSSQATIVRDLEGKLKESQKSKEATQQKYLRDCIIQKMKQRMPISPTEKGVSGGFEKKIGIDVWDESTLEPLEQFNQSYIPSRREVDPKKKLQKSINLYKNQFFKKRNARQGHKSVDGGISLQPKIIADTDQILQSRQNKERR